MSENDESPGQQAEAGPEPGSYLDAALAANALMTRAAEGKLEYDQARSLMEGADPVYVAAILAARIGGFITLLGRCGVDTDAFLAMDAAAVLQIAGGEQRG